MNTMRSRYRQAAGALALGALCTLGAGCGFFSREKPAEPVPSADLEVSAFSPIRSVFRIGGVYDIYSVTPDFGPLAGGNPALLDGVFPNPLSPADLAAVTQIYTVYFGYNIANYDFGAPPTMSSALIYVTVPAGDAPGLVDVIFRDSTTQLDAATLYYGYEYLDPFDITGVVPELGPIAGGQQVTVYGRFPILAPMTTIAEAYGAYRVYFDGIPAGFDSSMNPVITASTMYVITPPRTPPGLVDVSVATLVYAPGLPEFRVLPQSYEYSDRFDIFAVDPTQGPTTGGQAVTITGLFPILAPMTTIAEAYGAYRVYFDGIPAGFDSSMNPVITASTMHVLTPPRTPPGLVDISVATFVYAPQVPEVRILPQSYEYLDPFDITGVVPDLGPIAGGQQVTVFGRFPIAAPITTVAAADAAYRVYIDSWPAAFDSSFNPVITSGAMYVITPPGLPPNAPGLVDVSVWSVETPVKIRVLPLGYEYIGELDLTSVTPNRGFIFGDEPVTLGGTFPVSTPFSNALIASQASLYYTAYFGYRIAPFDQTVPTPVITPTQMLVRSPPAAAVGFVDVRVQEATDPRIADTLARAYRYYALYITDVIPDNGPVAGGTQVKIEGLIPAIFSIYNIYEAAQYYTVRFDGNVAAFDSTRNPIILPSQIDTINRTYTTGHMYVIAPPGAAPGFVDVEILDNLNIDLPAICPDCYEYTGGDDISRWDTAVVAPNPVGKLEAGELLVTITGVGKMTNAASDPVFIVPQGGEPDQTGDRIELETTSYNESGSGFTWEGTNKNAIPRVLNGLLVDGHAAVYILEASGDILGDDNNEPYSDGGVIQTTAQDGRHFLIDTVPPRLQLIPSTGGHLRGDDFVNPMLAVGNWTVNELDTSAVIPQAFPHPYDVSGLTGTANGFYDAPFDGNWMQRGLFPDSKAQVFFNVSSLTNNFADSAPNAAGVPTANLQFTLDGVLGDGVVFEDVDIYIVMGMDQAAIDAGRNADFFGGSRIRQVAGFTDGLNVSRTGLLRDEALTSGNRVLIQWDFQSTPFRLPEFEGVSVTYTATGPSSIGSNQGLSTNLAATPTELEGAFAIGDPSDPTTGVQLDEAGVRTMMSVVFRAVDRAGDYRPQSNATPGTKKLYTRNDIRSVASGGYAPEQQPEVGPLNLWWLRTTATRLISNIPASGDTRAPSFTWENTGEPDPGAFPDVANGLGSQRLYSYAIYQTDATSGTRDEQRDGRYTLVGTWSNWTTKSSLTTTELQPFIDANPGAWFLLVVMSCDEAGNIELWPETQLVNPSGAGPSIIDSVNDAGGAEERNWERWFVPPSGEAVDTRIEPLYWHDSGGAPFNGIVDTGEASFGDAEVIPYPSRATFSPPLPIERRVAAQIRVRLLTDAGNANADWELLENGVSVATGTGAIVLGDGFTVVLRDPYLGVASRQPAYYIFRARTFIDSTPNGILDPGEIYDTSPATVQFVVVDNVANYIQNRKSEDTQPIQEMDRP